MTNEEMYNKACDRVECRNGGKRMSHKEIIVDLEIEIDRYREKIAHLENMVKYHVEKTRDAEARVMRDILQPKPVILQCGIGEITKVAFDSGYNVSINFFKNDESED